MTNNQENITLSTFVLLFKYKWAILLSMLFMTISSTIYSLYFVEVQYKSTVNLVPPKSQGDAFSDVMASAGNALKSMGLSNLGGRGGSDYEYMIILDSRTVKDSIINKFNLAKVYDIPKSKKTKLRKAFESNLSLDYLNDGNYLISVWDKNKNRAAAIANSYADIANYKATEISQNEALFSLDYLEKRIASLDESLKKISDTLAKYSSKYKIFSIEEQSRGYADLISELKSSKFTYEILRDLNINKYGKEDFQTQDLNNIIKELNEKIGKTENTPGAVGNFDMNNATGIGLEYARLFAEFETYSKVKAFLVPTFEKAKLDLNKPSNNLFVVDKAIPADEKDRPKRALIVISASFGGFILSILIIIIFHRTKVLLNSIKNKI